MAFDRRLARVLLFGGDLFNDTWSYTGSTWLTIPTQNAPPGALFSSLAFDSGRDRGVLLVDSSGAGETWEWDGLDWRLRVPASPILFQTEVSFDARRGRTVSLRWDRIQNPQNPQTWEYFAPCDTVGQGTAAGGLALTCTTPPNRGTSFCLSFPSALGGALFLLGRTPCLFPNLVVDPPTMCTRTFVHAPPTLVLALAGNPAMPCFALANDPVLLGQSFCLQGFALQPGLCLAATAAVVATIQ